MRRKKNMNKLAIIGGTGLTSLEGLNITRQQTIETPYGDPSSALIFGEIAGREIVFLPRHGKQHTIPPHRINYRANIWALKHLEIENIIAVAAVGGIREDCDAKRIVIPDRIIDYTWARPSTFFEDGLTEVTHIDFTCPYDEGIREQLLNACNELSLDVVASATYGATQGPRLESKAEIDKLERDGCAIVGMTGMPEAALARELALKYAAITVVANLGAGRSAEVLTMEMIQRCLKSGMRQVRNILNQVLLASTD